MAAFNSSSSTAMAITEGFAPFPVPKAGNPCRTYYKIVGGSLADSSASTFPPPLICLHGGPGGDHRPMVEPLMPLCNKLGIPLIFYDQLGGGKSTRLPEKNGDTDFWTLDLFLDELRNLVAHLGLEKRGQYGLGFSLFGQSWGGMLACAYAATRPALGLKKVINSSGPASMPLYMAGVRELIRDLPLDVQRNLEECEKAGDTTSEKFQAVEMVWVKKHIYRTGDLPKVIKDMLEDVKKDPTVYLTMCGPSEFQVTGSMKDMVLWRDAHRIEVPVLIINGRHDEVTDRCLEPWFREIRNVKWVQLDQSSHLGMYEEPERFVEILGRFLTA